MITRHNAASLGDSHHIQRRIAHNLNAYKAAIRRATNDGLFRLESLFDELPCVDCFIKAREARYLAVYYCLMERLGLQSKAQVIDKRPCDICPGDLGRIP